MSDLIDRLRRGHVCPTRMDGATCMCCEAADLLDAINALHQPDWPDNSGRNPAFAFCRECRDNWPCPTNLLLHPENQP